MYNSCQVSIIYSMHDVGIDASMMYHISYFTSSMLSTTRWSLCDNLLLSTGIISYSRDYCKQAIGVKKLSCGVYLSETSYWEGPVNDGYYLRKK
jgi:hypothetical protein